MDERNAIAKARDDWFETKEGKSAMQKIEAGLDDHFLRNRLESAFKAGYEAAEKNFANYARWLGEEFAEEICRQMAKRPHKYKFPFDPL